MRTILIASFICLATSVLPCAHAQQSDDEREALRKRFLEYKTKAEKGDANAQHFLGQCYRLGQSVKQDYAEAAKWYRKAAEQNSAAAQAELGFLYDTGRGVGRNYAEAVVWYRKAAEQNHAVAQNNLGFSYKAGNGVRKDYVEGYAWLNLAAKTDGGAAQSRNNLERDMSPQQIAAGKKRTEELRAQIEAKLKRGGK